MSELDVWVEQRIRNGYTAEQIQQSLIASGYNAEFVNSYVRKKFFESQPPALASVKKLGFSISIPPLNKRAVALSFVLLIAIASYVFLYPYLGKVGHFSISKQWPALNNLDYTQLEEGWNAYSSTPLEEAIVNIIHIYIDDESIYRIACEYGPAYEKLNLIDMNPYIPIYKGQIRECSSVVAAAIDNALKNGDENGCVFPIKSRLPTDIKDYYAIMLAGKDKQTDEFIVQTGYIKCSGLIDILGTDSFYLNANVLKNSDYNLMHLTVIDLKGKYRYE